MERNAVPARTLAVCLNPDFRAARKFNPSVRNWEVDSRHGWENLGDKILLEHYQDHLEEYCLGCRRLGYIPTISGFRIYLKLIDRRYRTLQRLGLHEPD